MCDRIDQLSDASGKQVLFLNTELRALQGRIAGFGAALLAFVDDDENTCRWIETRYRPRTGKSIDFPYRADRRRARCCVRRCSSSSRR